VSGVLHPALDRALLAARDRRERRGASGDATVTIADLDAGEALALDGLLSLRRRAPVLPGSTLRVSLSRLETALRAHGRDPRAEYERVGGRTLRDLPAERAARRAQRDDFRAWIERHPVARDRPLTAGWLDQAIRQGRVHPDIQPLVAQALAIVAALPAAEPLQRTVLAARTLDGDSHGLDVGTPLHALVVALLAAGAGLAEGAATRAVWAAWNVVVDPISSDVAALNLPLSGAGPGVALAGAMRGTPVVLTYGQLSAGELRWPSGVACFSCENPSVLVAAEQALGPACPPLVCTGGRPTDAVRLVFEAVSRAPAPILHHGDYDDAGAQILADLTDRYGAQPWRFDVRSLDDALRRLGRPAIPSSRGLLEAVGRLSAALPEELLIDDLLGDLRAAASTQAIA
jgi:uncharacterized protein (TIGR02679 family)